MWIAICFVTCLAVCVAAAVVHQRQVKRQHQLAQDLLLAISSGDVAGVESIFVAYAHELSVEQRNATRQWLDRQQQPNALPTAKEW